MMDALALLEDYANGWMRREQPSLSGTVVELANTKGQYAQISTFPNVISIFDYTLSAVRTLSEN